MNTVRKVARATPCAPLPAGRRHVGAGRVAKLRAEFRAWRASLPAGLERDTLLMPDVIAESVCGEVSWYLDVPLPARYAVWLEAKAHRCYGAHRHFYKLMQARGNGARDRLYLFMRHWLASMLHLERPDLTACLPLDFSLGKALPSGKWPGGRARRRLAARDWDAARVTRHHRWAWLEANGCPHGSPRVARE